MSRHRGYSLLEVLIALSILGTAALALFAIAAYGLRYRTQGQERVIATGIATELMERIRVDGYLRIPMDGHFDGRVPQPAVGGFPPLPYPAPAQDQDFKIEVQTSQAAPHLRRVQITVHSSKAITRLESLFHP